MIARGWMHLFLVTALLSGCNSRHEQYGFASDEEMDGANAAGFLTKERLRRSMTPLAVPAYDPPTQALSAVKQGQAFSRDMIGTCDAVYSCAQGMMAAAREANAANIAAGASRILTMPQYSRGGGSEPPRADWPMAKRLSQLSRTRKEQAREAINEGLNANPRSSGLWLGMAIYQGHHGTREDAAAAAWLSWFFASDRAEAANRIRSLFYVEQQPAVKTALARAIVWIEGGGAEMR